MSQEIVYPRRETYVREEYKYDKRLTLGNLQSSDNVDYKRCNTIPGQHKRTEETADERAGSPKRYSER